MDTSLGPSAVPSYPSRCSPPVLEDGGPITSMPYLHLSQDSCPRVAEGLVCLCELEAKWNAIRLGGRHPTRWSSWESLSLNRRESGGSDCWLARQRRTGRARQCLQYLHYGWTGKEIAREQDM